jgi:uncharacterized spore protein YtfJ
MASDETKAMTDAIEAAEVGSVSGLLERLADRIGGRANVKAVFGEPIQQGDLTVVPVARVRWGIGVGGGRGGDAQGGSGSGGGGGAAAEPVGYLEIRPDGAVFQPIRPSHPSPVLVLAGGLAAAFVLRALLRGLRR